MLLLSRFFWGCFSGSVELKGSARLLKAGNDCAWAQAGGVSTEEHQRRVSLAVLQSMRAASKVSSYLNFPRPHFIMFRTMSAFVFDFCICSISPLPATFRLQDLLLCRKRCHWRIRFAFCCDVRAVGKICIPPRSFVLLAGSADIPAKEHWLCSALREGHAALRRSRSRCSECIWKLYRRCWTRHDCPRGSRRADFAALQTGKRRAGYLSATNK